jgi:hypothetical protein
VNVAELDEVQYDLEIDGTLVREQVHRKIWESRGWATVAIKFRERDAGGEWKPEKVALLRFRRMHEVWHRQAALTLSADEARDLAGVLAAWLP